MFWLLELVMLVGGLYTLMTGRLPKAFTGDRRTKRYEVSPGIAHLIGLVMVLPLPCTFLSELVISMTMDPDRALATTSFSNVAILLGAGMLAAVIYRIARKPVEFDPRSPEDDPHIQILWR